MRAALRGEDMDVFLPCVGTFCKVHAAGYKVGVSNS